MSTSQSAFSFAESFVEAFWVDLVVHNPFNAEVNLSDLTVVVTGLPSDSEWTPDLVDVEVLDDIILDPKETRTVNITGLFNRVLQANLRLEIPMSVLAKQPMTLQITHVTYSFLSLLPVRESLASHGRRLQDTPHQRQNKVYAPDVVVKVEVEDAAQRLSAEFFDDDRLVLYHGECRQMRIWLSNIGTHAIGDIWLISGQEDEFWIEEPGDEETGTRQISLLPVCCTQRPIAEASAPISQTFDSDNSLLPRSPYRIPLTSLENPSLAPGANFELPFVLHANKLGEHELCLLLTFREVRSALPRTTRSYC